MVYLLDADIGDRLTSQAVCSEEYLSHWPHLCHHYKELPLCDTFGTDGGSLCSLTNMNVAQTNTRVKVVKYFDCTRPLKLSRFFTSVCAKLESYEVIFKCTNLD